MMDDPEGPAIGATTPAGQQVQISATDEDMKGRYANLMSVSHTAEEFVLDYFAVTPSGDGPRGHLVSRVIVSPSHFKRVVVALNDNLRKYEEQFGPIEDPRAGMDPDDIGFVH